jgi:hypothetical protein
MCNTALPCGLTYCSEVFRQTMTDEDAAKVHNYVDQKMISENSRDRLNILTRSQFLVCDFEWHQCVYRRRGVQVSLCTKTGEMFLVTFRHQNRVKRPTFDAREFGQVIHHRFAGMDIIVDEWQTFPCSIASQNRNSRQRHFCRS